MRAAVTRPRNGDFDCVRGELGEVLPPRRGQTARRGLVAVSPNRRANACFIRERAIVGEIDAAGASSPISRLDASPHGGRAESAALRLSKGDHAVLAAQVFIEHSRWTPPTPVTLPSWRFRCVFRR